MDLISRFRYESKLFPGVAVALRRVSVTSRSIYFESLCKYRAQIREIQRKRKPLDDEVDKAREAAKKIAKAEVEQLMQADGLTREDAESRVQLHVDIPMDHLLDWSDLIDQETRLRRDGEGIAGLRAQFISIEGLTIDGKVPTIDELIESAPVELTDELIVAANGIAGLSPTERGESPWPGTLAQAEVGPANDSSAIPASGEQVAA